MSKKNSNVNLKAKFKKHKELSSIYSFFKEKIKSLKKKSFLVAVSGGPDSLALTALINFYSYENKCKVYYVLVDHNLRKYSSREASSVKKLLKRFRINLHILKNKKEIEKNIQSEARKIRYDLITKFCKKKRIPIVLTAHNFEDQVETFFIRLSRGSGLDGLSSMKQISKIGYNLFLVRPLLEYKKLQLVKISKTIFGKFYIDPSNENTKYLRTRIRNLKRTLEISGIKYDRIFQSIKNLASSRDTLDAYFKATYKDLVTKKKNEISIKIKSFSSINNEMKMRVFKRSIKDVTKSYYTPRSKKVIRLIHEIEGKKYANQTLGGCIILRDKERIIFKKDNKS